MTPRATAVQGALAALGLVAAYATWQRGTEELDTGEVFVIEATKNELEKIRFEDEGKWAELVGGRDQDGLMVWLRVSGHDASNIPLPSGHPAFPIKVPDREVRGSDNAKRLYERFAPLKATRGLGRLDPQLEKDLGLDKTKKRFEITVRGVKKRFVIAPAPPGGTDPYFKSEDDGRVYVIPRGILTDFESASVNLTERRFHPFLLGDFDKVVLTAGAKKKEFVAKRLEGRPDVELMPVATPDKPDTTVSNWHEKIFALFPAEVLGKGEVPNGGEPVVAIRLEYSARGQRLGWLDIARGGGSSGGGGDLYARSEYTAGWMKLNANATALLTEGETLIGQ